MISIPQGERTWDEVKANVPVGTLLEGVVKLIVPFGLFIDAGHGFACLMRIPDCGIDRSVSISDAFSVEQKFIGSVIDYDDRNHQIVLSRRNIVG